MSRIRMAQEQMEAHRIRGQLTISSLLAFLHRAIAIASMACRHQLHLLAFCCYQWPLLSRRHLCLGIVGAVICQQFLSNLCPSIVVDF